MNPDLETLPLRDIHLPDTVLWWPIAPGWWAIILILGFGLGLVYYIKKYKEQRKLRSAGIISLQKIILQYDSHQDAVKLVSDLSVLLRRLCISHCLQQKLPPAEKHKAQQKVANLTGKTWLNYLQRQIENLQLKGELSFISGAGRVLITVPYRSNKKPIAVDVDLLFLLCRAWINALPIERKGKWWVKKVNKKTIAAVIPG